MKHLEEQEEGYFEHGIKALYFGITLIALSFICFIHAFIPCYFVKTVSNKLKKLLKVMNRE